MSMKDTKDVQHTIDRFWHNYLFVLEKNAVPDKSRRWYRKHLEEYIVAHPDVKLRRHLPSFIDDYLIAKGRLRGGVLVDRQQRFNGLLVCIPTLERGNETSQCKKAVIRTSNILHNQYPSCLFALPQQA